MKKSFTSLVFILATLLRLFSQSTIPVVDSKQYEDMKQLGLLSKGLQVKNQKPFTPTLDDFKKLGITHQMRRPGGGGLPSPTSGSACSCYIPPDGTYTDAFPGGSDDGSTSQLSIPFNFCLYGTNYNSLYVNNNGNVSFDMSYGTFSSSAFPSSSYVMVAPFWGDVDTRGTGTVQYKITPTAMYINWVAVGYYSSYTDKVNTFQLIITNGSDPILPPGNNIAFCYGDMQWTTGDASGGMQTGFGGTPATVGVNKGDGTSFIQMGRFDQAGASYFGSYSNDDGIDWLDYKSFYFNSCSSTNLPPIASGFSNCDTIKICGKGDSLILNGLFLAPEAGQNTTISVNLNGTPNTSVISNIPGNSATAAVLVIATAANAGNNVITFTATDNGTPAGVTVVNVHLFVDTTNVSNFHPVLSGNLHICSGDSTQLSVTPTNYNSYMWNTGATSSSIYADTTEQYWVTSVYNGCYKTNFANVTARSKPTPVINSVPLVPCTITTTLSIDSLIYTSYLWSNSSTGTAITVGAGTYTVSVVDAGGCTGVSPPVTITTPPGAPAVIAHNDTSICAGKTVNLSVTFAGTVPTVCGLSTTGGCGGSALMAAVGNGTGTNATTDYPAPYGNFYTSVKQQFLFSAAELSAAGISAGKIDQMDFNISQINGIATYHEFTIKMGCTNLSDLGNSWALGLVQVYNPHTYTIAMGWNAHLFDNAFEWDGASNVVVEICFNEGPSFPNYTFNSSSPFTTTSFVSCLYSYSDGFDMCPDTTNFISQSNDRPNVQFHYCSAPNPSAYSYSWTPSSGNIANASLQSTTAQPSVATTYKVTVTNTVGGCSSSDSVQVALINISALAITPAGPYCVNGNLDTLHTSLPPGLGVWSGLGITDSVIGIFNPSIALAGLTHQIIYTINGSCGTGADTTNIAVIPLLDATITPVGNQCAIGAPITLSAATPGGTWSGNGITNASSGTFDPAIAGVGSDTVKYTITAPCVSVDTLIINVVSHLDPTITPAGPFCTSAPIITLQAVDQGGIWSGVGITDSITGLFNPQVAGSGNQEITYTISGLCGSADSTAIVVMASPVISFTTDKTQGCEPTIINFTGTTDQPGGSASWTFGTGQTSTVLNPEYPYQHQGVYSTTVTQDSLITVHSQPHALFDYNPQQPTIANPEVQFTDLSTGVINTWNWFIGTAGVLGTSFLQNPAYTFADTGSVPIELIVTNNFGCTDTTYKTIKIEPIFVFYAPNSFSPDGNGNNDVFMIKGDGIDYSNFEMDIFDRWGELIYKSSDALEGWNGRRNNTGLLLEGDVYIWKVYVKDFIGYRHYYIGHVTLLR
jgi:gliding motility-associated-like protein